MGIAIGTILLTVFLSVVVYSLLAFVTYAPSKPPLSFSFRHVIMVPHLIIPEDFHGKPRNK